MATRGRKPIPTALKVLEGNPEKRKLNNKEPKPDRKAPSCLKWLEPETKKEWRRLSRQMEQIGILTQVDMTAFTGATYIFLYIQMEKSERSTIVCDICLLAVTVISSSTPHFSSSRKVSNSSGSNCVPFP